MIKFKAILVNHITKWNSVAERESYSPVLWYLLGLLFGIIAKTLGTGISPKHEKKIARKFTHFSARAINNLVSRFQPCFAYLHPSLHTLF